MGCLISSFSFSFANATQAELEHFVKRLPNGKIQQQHTCKGIKIYTLPGSNQLVVDRAGKIICVGSSNKVKEVERIGDKHYVRLIPKSRRFMTDELLNLDKVSDILHVAQIVKIYYVNVKGQEKTRYLMEKYDYDAAHLHALSFTDQSRETILKGCLMVLNTLIEIHRRKLIHGDLRLENILCKESSWDLTNFERMKKVGFRVDSSRATLYSAPEIFYEYIVDADPSMDMYSFGMAMLRVMHNDLFLRWLNEQCKILKDTPPSPYYSDNRRDACTQVLLHSLANLHAELEKKADPCSLFIRDLLHNNPDERPTSSESYDRLNEIIEKRQYERGFFFGTLVPSIPQGLTKVCVSAYLAAGGRP